MLNGLPKVPVWNYTYFNAVINDAIVQIKRVGHAFVCKKEYVEKIKVHYPNIQIEKLHEWCYLCQLN